MITAYLCIFIAALFFASQFVFSKLFQCHSDGSTQAHLRMGLMQSVWVLLIFWVGRGFAVAGTPQAAGYALCYTVANIACSLASILAVSMGKLVTCPMCWAVMPQTPVRQKKTLPTVKSGYCSCRCAWWCFSATVLSVCSQMLTPNPLSAYPAAIFWC